MTDKLKSFSLNATPSNATDPDYKIWLEGVKVGRQDMKKRILDLLQVKYMDPTIDKRSDRAQAALELANELSKEL